MFLRTICPSCREAYELTDQQRGRKVLCPECNTLFAPEVEEVAEDDDPEPAEKSSRRRKRRKHGKRPRRISAPAAPTNWPLLAVVGLCVLSLLVAITALLVYLLR